MGPSWHFRSTGDDSVEYPCLPVVPVPSTARQNVAVPTPPQPDRILPWVLRLAWVGVAVTGWDAIDGATAERSDALRSAAMTAAAVVWIAGVVMMVVPAVISLTATRVIVPLALPAAAIAWAAGSSAVQGALFVAVAATSVVVAMSAGIGRAFVQASAYGDEDRHPLRPPAAYALAAVIAWAIWAATLFVGILLLAARQWVAGGVLTVIALAGGALLWPRWHRLSRRWLVYVPVGVVVHDQLVLAETLMLRRSEVARLRLAPADTEAADLTGPASGHAIEVVTSESVTVLRAATPSTPRGTAIHLTACLISPTRPGAALAAAGKRRLPVG
jgi:hypothetical protein